MIAIPDLLAHALVAFTVSLVVSWRVNWITQPYVTVCMAGAFIPDLAKIDLVLENMLIEQILGIPFDWFALHTGGGAMLSVLIGGLIVVPRERLRVLAMLSLGAVSHLLADALLITPSGRSYPILWPLTRFTPPTPGLYLSTQPEPMVIAAGIAIGVWILTLRFRS